jgi:hypothetical protein
MLITTGAKPTVKASIFGRIRRTLALCIVLRLRDW